MSGDTHNQPNSLKGNKRQAKKTLNWFTLGVCFFLSILLWFIVSLSKSYQIRISYPVKFIDIPESAAVNYRKKESLDLLIKASGFNLLLHQWFKPLDTLPISLLEQNDRNYIVTNRNLKSISHILPYSMEAIESKPDTLFFALDLKSRKKVPIINRVKFTYQDSYFPLEEPKFTPDSVWILGTPELLGKIKNWKTQSLEFSDISATFSSDIDLDTLSDISIQPTKVKCYLPVAEFTEGKVTVPIEIVNLPSKKKIRLNPDHITLKYLVPLSAYEKVSKDSFRVWIDVKKIKSGQRMIVPKLSQKPSIVQDVHLEPGQVGFVITQPHVR
ncbi:MAG: hypothetical protein EBS07_01645 [Sphingobacteriia bacterium]|nr:hypothetical protein [Sphingobacteriia bacterium]